MLGMLVMTGLDFAKAKADFCDQIVASLKKFRSRNGISDEKMSDGAGAVNIKTEDQVIFSRIETVLLAKGWMPPKAENRKWSRSVSLMSVNRKYKGKKNGLYKNFKIMKCYLCKCECEDKKCPCLYHPAKKCPQKKDNEKKKEEKPNMSWFIEADVHTSCVMGVETTGEAVDKLVLVVKERIEDLLLNITNEESRKTSKKQNQQVWRRRKKEAYCKSHVSMQYWRKQCESYI